MNARQIKREVLQERKGFKSAIAGDLVLTVGV